jgi:hypothetical protein
MKIAELPFREKPVLELLNLLEARSEPDHDYAGYGWSRVSRIWLAGARDGAYVDDALVLGLHTADDAEAIAGDIELEFELPDAPPVSVLASAFLARWLPVLPQASAIVLALCNPHNASLLLPSSATVPMHVALGDVTSWLGEEGERIELVADSWSTLRP